MNAHPHDPFDAEEAAAARAYRALPELEPPAALDARILAQARAAVAAPAARRRRPWFMGAGFGAAAAAVMAAGIAWQVGWLNPTTPGPADAPAVTAPASGTGSDANARDGAAEDRVDIEFYKQERKAPEPEPELEITAQRAPTRAVAPETPVTRAQPRIEGARPAVAPAPAAAAPAPPPPPNESPADAPAQPVRDAAPASAASGSVAPQAFPEESAESLAPADGVGALSADSARERDRQAAPAATEDAELETIQVTGARISGKQRALPPWNEDARLAPDEWIERIRTRVQSGDRQSAELSLRRFVLDHPRHEVPRDLRRLLVE